MLLDIDRPKVWISQLQHDHDCTVHVFGTLVAMKGTILTEKEKL